MRITIRYMPWCTTLDKKVYSAVRTVVPDAHLEIAFTDYSSALNRDRSLRPLRIEVHEATTPKMELAIVSAIADACVRFCREQSPPIQFGGFEIKHLLAVQAAHPQAAE